MERTGKGWLPAGVIRSDNCGIRVTTVSRLRAVRSLLRNQNHSYSSFLQKYTSDDDARLVSRGWYCFWKLKKRKFIHKIRRKIKRNIFQHNRRWADVFLTRGVHRPRVTGCSIHLPYSLFKHCWFYIQDHWKLNEPSLGSTRKKIPEPKQSKRCIVVRTGVVMLGAYIFCRKTIFQRRSSGGTDLWLRYTKTIGKVFLTQRQLSGKSVKCISKISGKYHEQMCLFHYFRLFFPLNRDRYLNTFICNIEYKTAV